MNMNLISDVIGSEKYTETSGGEEEEEEEGECSIDDDCDGGYCDEDKCVECLDDYHCSPDYHCYQGACVRCINDNHCHEGYICDTNTKTCIHED